MRWGRVGVVRCTKFFKRSLAVSVSAGGNVSVPMVGLKEDSTSIKRGPGKGCAASGSSQHLTFSRGSSQQLFP